MKIILNVLVFFLLFCQIATIKRAYAHICHRSIRERYATSNRPNQIARKCANANLIIFAHNFFAKKNVFTAALLQNVFFVYFFFLFLVV